MLMTRPMHEVSSPGTEIVSGDDVFCAQVPYAQPPGPESGPLTGRTRLRLAGLDAPVGAEVVRHRADALIVSQALPFLRLGAHTTDAHGRSGRLHRIALDVQGGVPRLLLEVAYDSLPPEISFTTRKPRRDETASYERCVQPAAAVAAHRESTPSALARSAPAWLAPWERLIRAVDRMVCGIEGAVSELRTGP